jgi:hypothetical protein
MESDSRSGFALAAATFALVLLGVLVTAGFYGARQEMRIGVASERATSAFYVAEEGANVVMSEWDRVPTGGLATWASATVSDTTMDGIWSVRVTRMSNELFFLMSNGRVEQGSGVYGRAGRNVGVVARSRLVRIDPPAAFSTKDRVRFVGKATVKGQDEHPEHWAEHHCDGDLTAKAGMLTDDSLNLEYKEKNFDISGTPPILEDPALLEEIFSVFGDLTWDELTSLATHTVSPRNFNSIGPTLTADGACDRSNVQNWGDPMNPSAPCGGYFPMIHVQGSGISKINGGGFGQGILLVDGNLWAGGDFAFYGLIIVKGRFETGGSGNRVYGGVMAGNAELEEQDISGGSIVQYSSCTLDRAARENPNLSWIEPVERRSWVDLSSVVGG